MSQHIWKGRRCLGKETGNVLNTYFLFLDPPPSFQHSPKSRCPLTWGWGCSILWSWDVIWKQSHRKPGFCTSQQKDKNAPSCVEFIIRSLIDNWVDGVLEIADFFSPYAKGFCQKRQVQRESGPEGDTCRNVKPTAMGWFDSTVRRRVKLNRSSTMWRKQTNKQPCSVRVKSFTCCIFTRKGTSWSKSVRLRISPDLQPKQERLHTSS